MDLQHYVTATNDLQPYVTATKHSFSLINDARNRLQESKFDRFLRVMEELNRDSHPGKQDFFVQETNYLGTIHSAQQRVHVDNIRKRLNFNSYRNVNYNLNQIAEKRYEDYMKNLPTGVSSSDVGNDILNRIRNINASVNRPEYF